MEITIIDDVDGGVIGDTLLKTTFKDNNNGLTNTFYAYKSTVADSNNGLMKVDLSALSGITVTSAYFGMDVWVFGGDAQTIDVFECLKDWIEGTKTNQAASAGEPTYNSQKHNLNPAWAIAGCEGSGTDHAISAESATIITATNSDLHFNLTNATVQNHIDNPGNNNGYVWISQDTTFSSNYWLGRSSEATSGNKPYFYMEYTEASTAAALASRSRMINL